ncbi:hypothetical protein AC578_9935 [Pseudocercospora eumusae]|uniref:Uncharacterized protein n=1 Tax=Pseudocercospora eumusae TaxID=321146 RepID=A0A139HB69_9PEZI|nr:hypothetical protein AC578_9935 [Pseudocercospora eumusae]
MEYRSYRPSCRTRDFVASARCTRKLSCNWPSLLCIEVPTYFDRAASRHLKHENSNALVVTMSSKAVAQKGDQQLYQPDTSGDIIEEREASAKASAQAGLNLVSPAKGTRRISLKWKSPRS